MSRLSSILTVYLLTGLLATSAWASSKDGMIENFSETVPLDGATSAEVTVELGLAEFNLRAGATNNLAQFDAIYDGRYAKPKFKVERNGDQAYVFIHMEDIKKLKNRNKKQNEAEYNVYLSPEPVINLKCEVGLGDNELDLSGLKISRLDLESGLAETQIILTKPNEIRAERIEIESGLGELKTDHFGYLRFDELSLESGLGSSKLDLRGFEGEGDVSVSVGMGDCTVILPRDVGVRLVYESSFLSTVDTDGFERIADDRYESKDYSGKESHLLIEIEVGMGSVTVLWQD